MKDKHVKGKDVKGQCDEKRDDGEGQKRKVANAEANSPDMEFPAFREGFKGFKHVQLRGILGLRLGNSAGQVKGGSAFQNVKKHSEIGKQMRWVTGFTETAK
jgi:hypothetical protein